jgi:hypothetical protein
MAANVIGSGSPDGDTFGSSATEKISFYGATTIVKPSVTWPNTATATRPNTATATTTLNETKVNRLMAALVNLGLIVTT